jgi:hypothetical protein
MFIDHAMDGSGFLAYIGLRVPTDRDHDSD